ncbi:MAG: hypothetical protein KDD58_08310 [Bdellovibrionales bacterium]|nr:hypothetical protein [Bdellovibrionales bacterium]
MVFFHTSCSRGPNVENSHLKIVLPQEPLIKKKIALLNIGNQMECYAVSVRGAGILGKMRSCGPATGLVAGFEGYGKTLSLSVPSGSDRIIDVYMLLLPPGKTSCPVWGEDFEDLYGSAFRSVYKVGSVSGVNVSGENVYVDITVQAPTDFTKNIVTNLGQSNACKVEPIAQLQSNGDVVSSSGISYSLTQAPLISSISSQSINDFSQSLSISLSPSGTLVAPGGIYNIPPYIRSVIRYPDVTNKVLGLLDDGRIISIDLLTGSTNSLTEINCPISTCKVPLWMKSIALGKNNKLYSLDYGGNVYFLNKSGSFPTTTQLPPFIDQITF